MASMDVAEPPPPYEAIEPVIDISNDDSSDDLFEVYKPP